MHLSVCARTKRRRRATPRRTERGHGCVRVAVWRGPMRRAPRATPRGSGRSGGPPRQRVGSRFSFPPRFREPGTSTWLRALHRALAAGPIWDAYHRAGSKASGIEQAATLKGSGPQDTSVGKCAATFRARSDAGGFPLLVHFNTRARRVTMTTANVRLGRRRRGAVAHPSG